MTLAMARSTILEKVVERSDLRKEALVNVASV